jgi:hypothetical protein
MNMKKFVTDYLIFWGVARCLRMMLAFAIEQKGREVTIFHTFLFMILQIINLAVISYFFIQSMSMNEDLPNKDENTPPAKVIVLAVAPFYIIAVSNFVEFLVRWFILFWFVFVILEDYTESVEKDRTSILEMLMPGTKTKAFDQVMKERLSQWDRIKRLFYYQLKLQRGSNCDVCMELFVEGEGTVQLECNN